MNEQNYASLEASKRLAEAGIVLETDMYWRCFPAGPDSFGGHEAGFELVTKAEKLSLTRTVGFDPDQEVDGFGVIYYPAPSMAEVWRELPKSINWNGLILEKVLCQREDSDNHFASYCWEPIGGYCEAKALFKSKNPADALIDLLIFVRKEADHA